jgi:hypothetical protein
LPKVQILPPFPVQIVLAQEITALQTIQDRIATPAVVADKTIMLVLNAHGITTITAIPQIGICDHK